MHSEFWRRLRSWQEATQASLKKHWWYLLITFIVSGTINDRFFGIVNRYVDRIVASRPSLGHISFTLVGGLWESITVGFAFAVFVLVILVVHAYISSSPSGKRADILVSPQELQRTLKAHGVETGRHIFLQVKVELREPLHATVTKYRMELSRDGIIDELTFQDDISKWEMTNWRERPLHADIRPLPFELNSGEPIEGWVHFVTERNSHELDRSRVRFIVQTAIGAGHAEIPAGREYWVDSQDRMIMAKT